jgi:hypothetical protein
MKKIHTLSLGLFAVLALCAFAAPSALAVSRLLANGAIINEDLPITVGGELLLKSSLGFQVLCSGIFDGLIEPEGILGFINEVLTLEKTLVAFTANDLVGPKEGDKLNCTPVGCENASVLVVALNLPWHIEVELEGTNYFLDFLEEGSPGYNIECKFLGITSKVFCDGLVRAELLTNAEGDATAWFNEATAGETSCSDGTKGKLQSEGEEPPLVDETGALITFSEA